MQNFFILGKNPILSKAEIEAVLQISDCRFQVADFWDRVLIIETEKELDVGSLNNRLGGTVKIGKILGKIDSLENFEEKFFELVEFGESKVFFGFSLYQLDPKVHLKKYQKELLPVAMEIKRILREEKNINSRYVVSKELELSSVIVKKNKLLQNGAEICFLVKDEEILVGQTLAVQAFEEFGARDFTRPSRDQVSGMLPPKLARIMINLAQVKEDAQILDPFCGSGTILQEALMMGYGNLIGSDNSAKAISDTKSNLEWLKKKYELGDMSAEGGSAFGGNYEILNIEVKELSGKIAANSIGAIVTEPYLGPALRGQETKAQIAAIAQNLEKLYLAAFDQFYKVLVSGGKVVCVFPIFKIDNLKLNILPAIRKMGYKLLNQDDLIYFRPQQLVWRDILIFEK